MAAPAVASALVLAGSVSLSIGRTEAVSLLGVLACSFCISGLCICTVCGIMVGLPCWLVSLLSGDSASCSVRVALCAERPVSAGWGTLSFVAGEADDSPGVQNIEV